MQIWNGTLSFWNINRLARSVMIWIPQFSARQTIFKSTKVRKMNSHYAFCAANRSFDKRSQRTLSRKENNSMGLSSSSPFSLSQLNESSSFSYVVEGIPEESLGCAPRPPSVLVHSLTRCSFASPRLCLSAFKESILIGIPRNLCQRHPMSPHNQRMLSQANNNPLTLAPQHTSCETKIAFIQSDLETHRRMKAITFLWTS